MPTLVTDRTEATLDDASAPALADERDRRLRAEGVPLEVHAHCLEGAALLADLGRHLPRAGDRTAAAYARRVTGLLGGRRFGLVVSELQQYGAPLWFRLRAFVRGLVAAVGPPATAKATLFLGNYRNTPFGLHRGQSSNFMFDIDGRKGRSRT